MLPPASSVAHTRRSRSPLWLWGPCNVWPLVTSHVPLSRPLPGPVASTNIRIKSHFVPQPQPLPHQQPQPPGTIATSRTLHLAAPGGALSLPPLPAASLCSLNFGCQSVLHREGHGATAQPGSAGQGSSGAFLLGPSPLERHSRPRPPQAPKRSGRDQGRKGHVD